MFIITILILENIIIYKIDANYIIEIFYQIMEIPVIYIKHLH